MRSRLSGLVLLSVLAGLTGFACGGDGSPVAGEDGGADGPARDGGGRTDGVAGDAGGGDAGPPADGATGDGGPPTDGPQTDGGGPAAPCVATAGGPTYDYGRDIVVDGAGNSFITGTFSGTATFGTTTLTAQGDYDGFVAKLDASCAFVWAVPLSCTGYTESWGLARDSAGNVYVAGSFEGSFPCGAKTLVSQGDYDVLVAKLDGSGNLVWCTSAGGTDTDDAQDITLDGEGNVYIVGGYRNTSATFGTTTLLNRGETDIFVAKLDTNGHFVWATSAGGNKEDRVVALAVDDQGQTYVTGFFNGTATIGTSTLTSVGMRDGFAAKVDAGGSFAWATQISGTLDDWGNAVALDGAGGLYVTGDTSSLATTYGTITKTPGSGGIFVGKLDLAGNFTWVTTAGGAQTSTSNGLAVDAAGNSYVAGYYGVDAIFGAYPLTSPTSDSSEIFVAKLDPAGTFLWATGATGEAWDSAISLAVDAAGQPHVVGFFSAEVTFGSKELSNPGTGTDIFMARLSANGGI